MSTFCIVDQTRTSIDLPTHLHRSTPICVELQKGCRFEGDVETPIFVVEEGVFFQGNCRMPREAETA